MQAVQPDSWRLGDELLAVGRSEEVTGEPDPDLLGDVGRESGDITWLG